jgi:hypothetical protein
MDIRARHANEKGTTSTSNDAIVARHCIDHRLQLSIVIDALRFNSQEHHMKIETDPKRDWFDTGSSGR